MSEQHDVAALDWDTPVDQDSLPFVTFPDNTEVRFGVTSLEKTRTKDGAFPMARLILFCQAESGQTTVRENLVLNTKCAWKLGEFFRAIGQRQHGQRIVPDWSKVEGASGRALLGVEEWTGRDGDRRESNVIKRFLDPAGEQEDDLNFG